MVRYPKMTKTSTNAYAIGENSPFLEYCWELIGVGL